MVNDGDTDNLAALLYQSRHLMINQHLCAVRLCVKHIGKRQAERVDRAVGHFHSPDYRRIDRRLHPLGLFRIDNLSVNPGSLARLHESGLIAEVILRKSYEKSVVLLHTMTRNLPQYHIFLYAFRCRFTVCHSITRTAMQQSVITSRSAGGEIETLHQQHTQPAQGAIARRTGTGRTSADDYHIELVAFAITTHISNF